jgi:hypothetical protein
MILQCQADYTAQDFRKLADDMVLQSEHLQGIKENEATDADFKKNFAALIEENIAIVVVDLFRLNREGFYKFAFFLRRLDTQNLYTEKILTNKTVPTILVKIIKSNYWEESDPNAGTRASQLVKGTMKVDKDFHV